MSSCANKTLEINKRLINMKFFEFIITKLDIFSQITGDFFYIYFCNFAQIFII